MFVAIYTTECGEIAWGCVAVNALIPFSVVFSTINREILQVVIEGGWFPRSR